MLVVKRNEWLENLVKNETMQFIDVDSIINHQIAA
jgi:hypothetical protein